MTEQGTHTVYDAEPIPESAQEDIERLLSTGDLFRYTAPPDRPSPVTLLEAEFAAFMGARYALAVSSCSAALFLSLRALDLPAGARVVIPAFTFAAVPSAVVHAGCRPVLVECGPDYRMDMEDFARRLDGADAVLVSHMRGHSSDMDRILTLARARGLPVIEDAAHSLGTLWNGRRIGTLGDVGCFSFQSYKLVNGGEGGILITDDPELVARAVVMSGAYEHNWSKHPLSGDEVRDAFARIQNSLPLYNMRMGNLAAAVIRPQIAEIPRRVRDGRANHDHVAAQLNRSPWLSVPAPLPGEERAPDSIQFNLIGMSDAQADRFVAEAKARGANISIFGRQKDNARAFWNWGFLEEIPELPRTRAMLMRACDSRLPARLSRPQLDAIAGALLEAAEVVMAAAA